MNNTFTTWGGKPLPDGAFIEILRNDFVAFFMKKLAEKPHPYRFASWCIAHADVWMFSMKGRRSKAEMDMLLIPPNAAPEYIAWCREQGIEVPGGEIKRVECDISEATIADWIPPVAALELLHKFPYTTGDPCDICYDAGQDVTATLTLEMKP